MNKCTLTRRYARITLGTLLFQIFFRTYEHGGHTLPINIYSKAT